MIKSKHHCNLFHNIECDKKIKAKIVFQFTNLLTTHFSRNSPKEEFRSNAPGKSKKKISREDLSHTNEAT